MPDTLRVRPAELIYIISQGPFMMAPVAALLKMIHKHPM